MNALTPVRRRLLGATGGAALLPLLLLCGFHMADELDRVAFVTLGPEIRHTFGLTNKAFLAVVTISNAVVIFGALPMGRLADRYDRVRLSRGIALLWALGSVLVGVSPVLAVLVVGRLLGGLGRIAVEPLHAALLADFYPGPTRPRVYAVHRLAAFLWLVGAPIGALIAAVAGGPQGWRWAFGFLALPTLVLIGYGRRLGDPGRHGDRSRPGAALPDTSAPLGLLAALRVLAGLRTLRRLWLSALLFGAGAASLPIFIGLFAD